VIQGTGVLSTEKAWAKHSSWTGSALAMANGATTPPTAINVARKTRVDLMLTSPIY
jgi:hypothetical protein